MVLCALLVLGSNASILVGVFYNRSGQPVASITLTERELRQVEYYDHRENSGSALKLNWKVIDDDGEPSYWHNSYSTPEWLDKAKLVQLGFNPPDSVPGVEKSHRIYEYQEVVFALEYEGDAYQRAIEFIEERLLDAEQKASNHPEVEKLIREEEDLQRRLAQSKNTQSRLFVVDAGTDAQILRQLYPGDHYLFVRGGIGLRWHGDEIKGYIRHMHVNNVHVGLPFSEKLNALTEGETFPRPSEDDASPRYRVRLDMGRRLEPWVADIF